MEDLTNSLKDLEIKIKVLEEILKEFKSENDWKQAKLQKLDPKSEDKWLERQPYLKLTLNKIFSEKQILQKKELKK